MFVDLVPINNPRTSEGGWEDEKNGCELCGAISSVYIDVHDNWWEFPAPIRLRLCLGCIHKAIDEAHKLILKQCEKRVE